MVAMKAVKNLLRAAFSRAEYLSVGLAAGYRLASGLGARYRIPVLVYHKVTADFDTAAKLSCAVTLSAFESHMACIHDAGFKPISMEQYSRCVIEQEPFGDRTVLITFDDGYRSLYTRVWPVLRWYGFPAVVFVATGSMGGDLFPRDKMYADEKGWPNRILEELRPLTWDDCREIGDLIAIEAHTVTHPRMGRLSEEKADWEVRESKRQIEERLGREVLSFAYPDGIRRHGDYNDSTREALIRAGYKVAFNSEIGRNRVTDDPYEHRRIEPRQADSAGMLKSKLLGGYDWVRVAQSSFHRAFKPDVGFKS